jgi:salicylate hydroxylase
MHFAKRLHSYTEQGSGRITMYFMDNSTAVCDILIGADGIKSAVRRSLLIEKSKQAAKAGRLAEAEEFLHRINPIWTGVMAYQARVSTEKLRAYRDAHPDQKIRIPGANSTPCMVGPRYCP